MSMPQRMPAQPMQLHAQQKLLKSFSEQHGLDESSIIETVRATILPGANDAQLFLFIKTAEKYRLDPFTKQIHAFTKGGGVMPIPSIDGWLKVMQEHPDFGHFKIVEAEETTKHPGALGACPVWIECWIKRKSFPEPIAIRERLSENFRNTEVWKTNTSRMLRHRATIQAIRYVFGIGDLHDPEDAAKIPDARPFTEKDITPVHSPMRITQAEADDVKRLLEETQANVPAFLNFAEATSIETISRHALPKVMAALHEKQQKQKALPAQPEPEPPVQPEPAETLTDADIATFQCVMEETGTSEMEVLMEAKADHISQIQKKDLTRLYNWMDTLHAARKMQAVGAAPQYANAATV